MILGRVIRTQTPYPATFGLPLAFTEHYYYDGDRRIQEVATAVQLDPESGKPIYVKDELSIQTVISRDYVWDPDGGDSLIAQFDAANDLWFVISSLSGDAAALMSESGAVVAQYAFDPYGNVLNTDSFSIHSPLWIGHKGLFFDRLDQPLNPQRLAAGAEGHYHNRARTYAPKLGRFMQADPNASGLPVTGELAWMGTTVRHCNTVPDVAAVYMNGVNLHGYVGSNPTQFGDATGLFIATLPGLLGPTTTTELELDHIQNTLDRGLSLYDCVESLFGDFVLNNMLDQAWATDWSEPDDLYSRSAAHSMNTGSWEPTPELGDYPRNGPTYAGAAPSWLGPVTNLANARATGIGVYIVRNPVTQEIEYIGRSVNLATRMAVQRGRFAGMEVSGIVTGCKLSARSLEDILIRHYQSVGQAGQNLISGISMGNKNRKTYYGALKQFLGRIR